MTEEQIKQEVREQIARVMTSYGFYVRECGMLRQEPDPKVRKEFTDQILSIPNLAIINPKAELPENPFTMRDSFEMGKLNAYNKGQQSLISQDWVKRIGGK